MIKLKPLIQELLVKTLNDNPTYFIAWRDKVFLFGGTQDIDSLVGLYDHLSEHPAFDQDDLNMNMVAEDPHTLVSYASDMPSDVISGIYDGKNRSISIMGIERASPVTSVILKKIIKALKLKHVYRTDGFDDTIKVPAKKFKGKLPSIGYHGTNTENMEYILKNGLMAGAGNSNFSNLVDHENEIFFAVTFDAAKFYAENSTMDKTKRGRGDSYYAKKHGVSPVILEINIPDPSLVVPDFDADATSQKHQYYQHDKNLAYSSLSSMGASMEVGKFGYKGKILPQQIRWIYFQRTDDSWVKFRPSTVRTGLNSYDSDWYMMIGII